MNGTVIGTCDRDGGKGERQGKQENTVMLCVNAEDCGIQRVQGAGSWMMKESIVGHEAI